MVLQARNKEVASARPVHTGSSSSQLIMTAGKAGRPFEQNQTPMCPAHTHWDHRRTHAFLVTENLRSSIA